MAEARLKLEVRVSWWVYLYLRGVAFVCSVTGYDPDMDKVIRWIERGIRVKGR
jgi:hypothetical protein